MRVCKPKRRAQGVVEPLLHTLCAMHGFGWIHRDIKPENIFLTEADEFRLGDFGLSINFDEEEPFHISGARSGVFEPFLFGLHS